MKNSIKKVYIFTAISIISLSLVVLGVLYCSARGDIEKTSPQASTDNTSQVTDPTETTNSESPGQSEDTQQTSVQTPSVNKKDLEAAMKEYKEVLRNEAEFYNTDHYATEKNVYIRNYMEAKDIYESDIYKFAVVDMDGDGIPEIAIETQEFTLILRYESNTVYGFDFNFRHMYNIRKDGSYVWNAGADNAGTNKIQFFGAEYSEISIESYEDIYDEDGDLVETIFLVNSISVTEEEYNLFVKQRDKIETVSSFELNEENITLKLDANTYAGN